MHTMHLPYLILTEQYIFLLQYFDYFQRNMYRKVRVISWSFDIIFLFFYSPDIPDDPEDVSPMPPPDDIPTEALDAVVPLDALYRVLHHGETAKGDSHRFSVTADPEDATSRVSLPSNNWLAISEN